MQSSVEPNIQLLHATFPDPASNLALEEALLEYAEEFNHPGFLRFWESPIPFVVLGYGKKLEEEVYSATTTDLGIPVMRRCSGGGTVLQGRGCFSYALILPIDSYSALETITGANNFIMERNRGAIQSLLPADQTIEVKGYTDLTCNGLKFSGNAQRRKRTHILFHGAFLLHYDLPLVERVLKMPVQQPEYRGQRTHLDFIQNLPLSREAVRNVLSFAWKAESGNTAWELPNALKTLLSRLVEEKYGTTEWNLKF
ncbi:MAG: lipoate--protein ligase family protein [Verrucomicrobiales bacterium]